jgi:hypothetical protein
MPDQSVMTTPIFDELVAELGHELDIDDETSPPQRDAD